MKYRSAKIIGYSLLIVLVATSYLFYSKIEDAIAQQQKLQNYIVQTLETDDMVESDTKTDAENYPSNIYQLVPKSLTDKISVYGAANQTWLGLKGWTGKSIIGVDGTMIVNLYPQGGSSDSGPRITYYEIPACMGCMLDEAAKYFSNALNQRKKQYADAEPLQIPKGLEVAPISSSLVTYKIPNDGGMSTNGAAFYGKDNSQYQDYYYVEAILIKIRFVELLDTCQWLG